MAVGDIGDIGDIGGYIPLDRHDYGSVDTPSRILDTPATKPAHPIPAITPLHAAAVTLCLRNSSRAWMLEKWTSMTGHRQSEIASRSA
jgi:hypothetical protein